MYADEKTRYQDSESLKHKQYATSKNLQSRASLHERFSTSSVGWFEWVFDQLAVEPNMCVLECGGGAGWLWQKNATRLPDGIDVTLTDFSAGMVAEASQNLADHTDQFTFREANIQQLSFEADTFDLVVANHMLYHVPDIPLALREVRRVLKPGGRFVAATNGNGHMLELMQIYRMLAESMGNTFETVLLPFRLENGRELLASAFSQIEWLHFQDGLAVTDAHAVIDYVLSSSYAQTNVPDETISQAIAIINEQIGQTGTFRVQKEQGLFVAQ